MLKKNVAAFVFMLAAFSVFAYNPPAGGENLFGISSPSQLTSASSAAGGGLFSVTPSSIVFNPALIATEQRIMLDVGYTALFGAGGYGNAFQLGMVVPTKWCIADAVVQGIMSPSEDLPLGNSLNLKTAVSKEITDKLSVGLGVGSGFFWDHGSDWALTADLGMMYSLGNFYFLKNTRLGVSLLNLGKPYTDTDLTGIYDNSSSEFPEFCTLRAGGAATLFTASEITGGASFDVAVPGLQNVVFDTGFQMSYRDMIKLSTAWEFNTREFLSGNSNLMPSIGLSFKFMLNSKKDSYLSKKGWQQSEMSVSTAWQQLYGGVNASSAGATLKLGTRDNEAPEIKLWDTDGGND
jgi:hypothetical protein